MSNQVIVTVEGQGMRIFRVSGDLLVVFEEKTSIFCKGWRKYLFRGQINYPEAVLGTKVDIPTLDGISTLKIPPGIQSGKLLRMRSKGFPLLVGQIKEIRL